MGSYLQILALIIAGIILLWFGYTLFLGSASSIFRGWFSLKNGKTKKEKQRGVPGDPQVCPICSTRLIKGELVKTIAFPSATGSIDRLMYIRGCYTCLNNELARYCPICGIPLEIDDYLVARMFERSSTKNHVHILGCNHCKKTGSLAK